MRVRRPQDIAGAIREARRAADISQAELASKLEVNREWVVRLESGEPGVSLGIVLRALTVLGLAVTIGDDAEKKPAEPVSATSKRRPPISIDEIVDD